MDGTGGTERQEGIHYVKSVKSVCELFGAVSESKAVFRYDDAWRLSRIDVTDEDGSYAVGYAWEETKLTVTTDYGDGESFRGTFSLDGSGRITELTITGGEEAVRWKYTYENGAVVEYRSNLVTRVGGIVWDAGNIVSADLLYAFEDPDDDEGEGDVWTELLACTYSPHANTYSIDMNALTCSYFNPLSTVVPRFEGVSCAGLLSSFRCAESSYGETEAAEISYETDTTGRIVRMTVNYGYGSSDRYALPITTDGRTGKAVSRNRRGRSFLRVLLFVARWRPRKDVHRVHDGGCSDGNGARFYIRFCVSCADCRL